MNPSLISLVVAAALLTAIRLAVCVRQRLPEHHLSHESKDTVKIAMGLVATMSALLLGLLVSSTQDSYKTVQDQVITLGAKLSFMDRVLSLYGPEAASLQTKTRVITQTTVKQMWSTDSQLNITNRQAGDALYLELLHLDPQNEVQENLKAQGVTTYLEIGQLRTLMQVQAQKTMTWPLLIAVVFWLVVIFFSFSLFSPSNTTASVALMVSALSVAVAIFLILELNQPFKGLIQISPALLEKAVP
jgi:Protein of unknown function (DUF4239)